MSGRLLLAFILFSVIGIAEMKSKKKIDYATEKELTLQKKETTPVDFTRLLVMRVFYGLARIMGLEDQVAEVLNGALVPPGADDDDDFDDEDSVFADY